MANQQARDEGYISSSSEDEIYNSEEYNQYLDEAIASQGFDVKFYPRLAKKSNGCGIILPVYLGQYINSLTYYTKFAIEKENKKKDAKLKFEGIVKANLESASPINYYITFKASDANGEIKTYQTKVRSQIPREDTEVEIFRLKPNMEQDDVTKKEACNVDTDDVSKGEASNMDADNVTKEEVDCCCKKPNLEAAVDDTEKAGHSSKKQKKED